VVLVANHESWWDGFLLRRVQRSLRPDARFHAVMLQRELSPRPFLRLLGGIGVEPGSVSSTRGLLRTLERLRVDDPSGVLAYFPQGEIRPGSSGPLGFRRGVLRVIEAMAPAHVLPVGIRVLPGASHRQDAFLSVGEALPSSDPDAASLPLLEAAVAEELAAIDAFVDRHAEGAASRWLDTPLRLPRAPERTWSPRDTGNWISRN
jgi:1-acyl-sn-glycerol-3-phosphate acyltransferase